MCKRCGAAVTLYSNEDPHAALKCSCCPIDHHHGIATATTGVPCRPVTHIYTGEGPPPAS